MADSLDTVISMIRGCLISTKGGTPLGALQRDYRSLVGKSIPYHEFGYSSLESFLRSIPVIKMTTGRSKEILVDAVTTEASAHIVNLVNRQKDTSKKRLGKRSMPMSRAGNRFSNARASLSITLSNNSGYSDRQFRRVTVGKSQKYVSTDCDSPSPSSPSHSKDHTYKSKFEVPPRLQKVTPILGRSSSVEQQNPPTVRRSASMEQPNSRTGSPEDLHKDFSTRVYIIEENNRSRNIKHKSLTTPYSPQAAIAAGRAKCEPDYNMPRKGRWDMPQRSSGKQTCNVYCEKLKEYSSKKNWSQPVYKILPRFPKDSRPLYGCQVKLGNEQQFASYPDESYNAEEARELAAKKAFLKLEQMDSEALLTTYKVTDDNASISERITQLVENFPHGLWSEKVLTLYREKYSETLPDDWITIIASCPRVSIDYVSGNRVIICPHQPSADNPLFQNHASVLPNSADVIPPIPNNLVLPDNDNWYVHVSCTNSTTEIWIQLIGENYSEKYEIMSEDMKKHYTSASEDLHVDVPEIGQFYAVVSEDSWHRVCVQDIVADSVATVWFVDLGDVEDFSFNELYKLDKKFRYLPRQAVQCTLAGLEAFSEEDTAYNVLSVDLLDKICVADIKSKDLDTGIISLVLYDTSTDDDINMNALIHERINFEKYKAQLPPKNGIKEMQVSFITPNGEVFLQQAETAAYTAELAFQLASSVIDANKLTSLNQVSAGKLYLAKYAEDNCWYRAVITVTPTQADKIDIIFVDYGSSDIVDISDLADLEKMSPELYKLPFQAIRVQLYNLLPTSMTQKMLLQINEFLSGNDPVLVKVIEEGDVSQVEIFKRSPKADNTLVSVNNTVLYKTMPNKPEPKPQKRKLPVVGLNNGKGLHDFNQGDILNSRGLLPPQIPDIDGDFFDIYVTMAANPSNFTVQPLNNIKSLHDMMLKMQDFYHAQPAGFEVSRDCVQEGGLYAVKHDDGHWYRANLINIISPELVSVHFSDFGDISVLPPENIRVLASQFKELSYQAIKAKLTGIVPSHSDWSIEDCLRFQDLVVNKTLVTLIKETGPDLINPNDTVIGLQIIDTSTDVDVDIAELLVNEGRAIYN